MNIPDDIQQKIVAKRTPAEPEAPKEPETKVVPPQEEKKPEGEVTPKPAKPNSQSIAQVAEAAADEDDDNDDEGDDGDKSKAPDSKKKSVFQDLIDTKRDFREFKKTASDKEVTMLKDMTTLLDRVEALEKSGTISSKQADERAAAIFKELEADYGLDEKAIDKIGELLGKKFGNAPKDDAGDSDTKKRIDALEKEKQEDKDRQTAEKTVLKIEKAIEGEYAALEKLYPGLSGVVNVDVVKRYIVSDEKNLSRSMEEIVREMYPKALGDKPGALDGYSPTGERTKVEVDINDPHLDEKLRKDPKFRESYANDLRTRMRGPQPKK